jgi:hypothetical protein
MLLRPCALGGAACDAATSRRVLQSRARVVLAAAPALPSAERARHAAASTLPPRRCVRLGGGDAPRVRRRAVCVPTASLPAAVAAAATSPADAAEAEPVSAMLKYYAAFLVFGCAVNTIGPMLPSLAQHVGLTPVQMAPLLTAKGLGGLLGTFLCPLLPLVRPAAASCSAAASAMQTCADCVASRAGISHAWRPAEYQRLLCNHPGGH